MNLCVSQDKPTGNLGSDLEIERIRELGEDNLCVLCEGVWVKEPSEALGAGIAGSCESPSIACWEPNSWSSTDSTSEPFL